MFHNEIISRICTLQLNMWRLIWWSRKQWLVALLADQALIFQGSELNLVPWSRSVYLIFWEHNLVHHCVPLYEKNLLVWWAKGCLISWIEILGILPLWCCNMHENSCCGEKRIKKMEWVNKTLDLEVFEYHIMILASPTIFLIWFLKTLTILKSTVAQNMKPPLSELS